MNSHQADADWEQFARESPYWAVLTRDEYKARNLSAEAKAAFFKTGEETIEYILGVLGRHFDAAPRGYSLAVDFGCGVGRLVLPLAQRCQKVVGIDVSPTMLDTARRNAEEQGRRNVDLLLGDDDLSALRPYTGRVELAVSMLVFQHIPPRRGVRLLEQLLACLAPEGFGYLHFTHSGRIEESTQAQGDTSERRCRYFQRFENDLTQSAGERPRSQPVMEMNHYNVNELLTVFYDRGIEHVYCRQYLLGSTLGVEFAFRKH